MKNRTNQRTSRLQSKIAHHRERQCLTSTVNLLKFLFQSLVFQAVIEEDFLSTGCKRLSCSPSKETKGIEGIGWEYKPTEKTSLLVINKPFGSNGQPAVHRESHRNGPNRQSRETCSRLGPEDRKRSVWTGWMGRRFRTPLYAMKRRAHMRQEKKERSGGYLLSHG
jgi:hypothetical protein